MTAPTSAQSPATSGRRYAVVSPCRNEEQFMRRTLDSVTGQSTPPALWVIVDDGSTDSTPKVLAEYAARFPYIRVVRREDRGVRSVGPGVIEAFYAGLDTIRLEDFDYVCKLDLDLDLPVRYFERLMELMEAEPRIGTLSGKAYYVDDDERLVSENIGDEVSVGASKFYRVECFRQIGGFVRQVMWDGIDCHRCRMMGWIAQSRDDTDIRFIHLRPMGTSHQGIWTGRKRHGSGQYFMGTGLWYMTASAIYRMFKPPIIVGGIAMWWGYVQAMIARKTRYDDPAFRTFLRRYQWEGLLLGKARAASRATKRHAHLWNPDRRDPAPIDGTTATASAA